MTTTRLTVPWSPLDDDAARAAFDHARQRLSQACNDAVQEWTYAVHVNPGSLPIFDGVLTAATLADATIQVARLVTQADLLIDRLEAVAAGQGRRHVTVWTGGGE